MSEDTIMLSILTHTVKARRVKETRLYAVYWMDDGGWLIWPEMVQAGYLTIGKTIPGSYGDYPIFVSDKALTENGLEV